MVADFKMRLLSIRQVRQLSHVQNWYSAVSQPTRAALNGSEELGLKTLSS